MSDSLPPRSSLKLAGGVEQIEALGLPIELEESCTRLGLRMVTVTTAEGDKEPVQCDSLRITESGHLLLLDAAGDALQGFASGCWQAFRSDAVELG